jgi:hypothetical protein
MVGTRAQSLSAAAAAAHIASRLSGIGTSRQERDSWLKGNLGLKLRSNGLDRAAQQVRTGTMPWLLVDEPMLSLDLERALVVFPGSGSRRPKLIARLEGLGTARQILVTRSRRDVLCILVYRTFEREGLFAAAETLGEAFLWDEVLEEDRRLEGSMWTALAQRAAGEESLLSD